MKEFDVFAFNKLAGEKNPLLSLPIIMRDEWLRVIYGIIVDGGNILIKLYDVDSSGQNYFKIILPENFQSVLNVQNLEHFNDKNLEMRCEYATGRVRLKEL